MYHKPQVECDLPLGEDAVNYFAFRDHTRSFGVIVASLMFQTAFMMVLDELVPAGSMRSAIILIAAACCTYIVISIGFRLIVHFRYPHVHQMAKAANARAASDWIAENYGTSPPHTSPSPSPLPISPPVTRSASRKAKASQWMRMISQKASMTRHPWPNKMPICTPPLIK